ncbi:unnamed protein product, partial [Mesorhabditis spiculigera]
MLLKWLCFLPFISSLQERHNKLAHGKMVWDLKEYYFMASLQVKDINGNWIPNCGATILNAEWLVTAGHCVAGFDKKKLAVVVGTADLDEPEHGQTIGVSQIIVHEDFAIKIGKTKSGKHNYTYNDIAVIKLAKKVKFGSEVGPVKLVKSEDGKFPKFGQKATVLGWGLNEFGRRSSQLEYASQNVYSKETCLTEYPADLQEMIVCAGKEFKGPCPGDSGGPLVLPYE